MQLLILGGTGFIGPHMVQEALRRGHAVTLYNRGNRPERVPEGVRHLAGDRAQSLAPLRGLEFDAVIDTCGYLPRVVEKSCAALRGSVGRYLFISSVSAYAASQAELAEDAPLAVLPPDAPEAITGETYGAYKVLCEQRVQEFFDDTATILRPGLIVGPGDHTDRFTYWPARFADGGTILCPGQPSDPVQVIDVRDLASFALELLENGTGGVFNAVGPREGFTIGELIETCHAETGKQATLHWVDAQTLEQYALQPWGDLPVWLPGDSPESGMAKASLVRARAAGLKLRPFEETVRDTLTFWQSLPEARRQQPKAGMSRAREQEVLKMLQSPA